MNEEELVKLRDAAFGADHQIISRVHTHELPEGEAGQILENDGEGWVPVTPVTPEPTFEYSFQLFAEDAGTGVTEIILGCAGADEPGIPVAVAMQAQRVALAIAQDLSPAPSAWTAHLERMDSGDGSWTEVATFSPVTIY